MKGVLMKLRFILAQGRLGTAMRKAQREFKEPRIRLVGKCPYCHKESYIIMENEDLESFLSSEAYKTKKILNDSNYFTNILLFGGVHKECLLKKTDRNDINHRLDEEDMAVNTLIWSETDEEAETEMLLSIA
jgi:hypothetical protein